MHTLKKANISHFLGIDFGKAKIGLAVADSETRIAFAYGTVKNNNDIFKKIAEIVEKEGIGKIIVGELDIRGFTSSQFEVKPRIKASEGRRFGDLLTKKLKIPIEFQNELYSTQMAERGLKEKGAKKIKRFDDQEAARIILQSWLDKKR